MNTQNNNNNRVISPVKSVIQTISRNKVNFVTLILLVVYVIVVCNLLLNMQNKLLSSWSSIFVILIMITFTYLIYTTLVADTGVENIGFDVFKCIVVFICYIFLACFFYYHTPGGYIMDHFSTSIYICILSIGLFCALYLYIYIMFWFYSKKTFGDTVSAAFDALENAKTYINKIMLFFLIGVVAITVISLLVSFLVTEYNKLSSMSTASFAVNIITIIIFAAIVFQFITYTNFYQNSPLTQLIINSIFYIPCLLIALFNVIFQMLKVTLPIEIVLFVVAVAINLIYYYYPYVTSKIDKQGGTLLIDNPVNINKEIMLDSYQNLNKTTDQPAPMDANNETDYKKYNYGYAISFWFYIDDANPSISNAYTKYTSLLNYGNKPNISYKGTTNSIMVTMDLVPKSPNSTSEDSTEGDKVIYVKKDVLLQKWNNMIINYNGGTLDIFYNGELVKTSIEVVPYMNYDALTVGSENGINGRVCTVNYFNAPLNIQQINALYNSMKSKNPPVNTTSEQTIVNEKNMIKKGKALYFS